MHLDIILYNKVFIGYKRLETHSIFVVCQKMRFLKRFIIIHCWGKAPGSSKIKLKTHFFLYIINLNLKHNTLLER